VANLITNILSVHEDWAIARSDAIIATFKQKTSVE